MQILDEVNQVLDEASGGEATKPIKRRTRTKEEVSQDTKNLQVQHGFSGERVKIVVEKGHEKHDPKTVFVRINDYTCEIPRGVTVDVPVEVAQHLENTVQTTFDQPESGVLIANDALRFPVRRVYT